MSFSSTSMLAAVVAAFISLQGTGLPDDVRVLHRSEATSVGGSLFEVCAGATGCGTCIRSTCSISFFGTFCVADNGSADGCTGAAHPSCNWAWKGSCGACTCGIEVISLCPAPVAGACGVSTCTPFATACSCDC